MDNPHPPGGNTTTAGAVEIARRIAEKQARDAFDPWIANEIRDGRADERAEVQTALAAIIETQRRDAELAEKLEIDGDDWEPPSYFTGARAHGQDIAAAIRSGGHYGKEKP